MSNAQNRHPSYRGPTGRPHNHPASGWLLAVICHGAVDGRAGRHDRECDVAAHPAFVGLLRLRPEWVVNAYTLAFGGLLLLGGRASAICLGRRRVFIFGVLLFSLASLAGGLGHLAGVAARGTGDPRRRRCDHGTDCAVARRDHLPGRCAPEPGNGRLCRQMSVAGATTGLIAGGVLTTYPSWRWVFFVNAPIGVALALAAPRRAARIASPRVGDSTSGAITATSGLVALVYGLTSAAAGPDGASQWTGPKVVVFSRTGCGAAHDVCDHRASQYARAAAAAAAARSQSVGRLPDHALRRHCAFRHVLPSDDFHADRLGVQRAKDRSRLSPICRRRSACLRGRSAARASSRRPPIAAGRLGDHGQWPVLAISDQ